MTETMILRNATATALLALSLGGCRVDSHKDKGNDNVNISTPFGGMTLKTNDKVSADSTGLPAYPGAELVKNERNHDAADVNMSFGSFQLRVKAMTFRTPDEQDKVETFYRTGLHRFGDVVKCNGNNTIGTPTHTAEGLTCETEKQSHVYVLDTSGSEKIQLKAGSKQHQHIVAMEQDGAGTKFTLVAVDLPGTFFGDSGKPETSQ